jgi:hypothetical protein
MDAGSSAVFHPWNAAAAALKGKWTQMERFAMSDVGAAVPTCAL